MVNDPSHSCRQSPVLIACRKVRTPTQGRAAKVLPEGGSIHHRFQELWFSLKDQYQPTDDAIALLLEFGRRVSRDCVQQVDAQIPRQKFRKNIINSLFECHDLKLIGHFQQGARSLRCQQVLFQLAAVQPSDQERCGRELRHRYSYFMNTFGQ